MIFLVWSRTSVMTEARPTSEPVPDVVGTAIDRRHAGDVRRACTSPRDLRSPRSAASGRPSARSPCRCRARCRRRTRSRRHESRDDTPRRHSSTLASTGFACTSENTSHASPAARHDSTAFAIIGSAASAGIRDEQRPLHAERLAGVGQLGDAAGAEANARRVVPVAAKHRHRSSDPSFAGETTSAASGARSRRPTSVQPRPESLTPTQASAGIQVVAAVHEPRAGLDARRRSTARPLRPRSRSRRSGRKRCRSSARSLLRPSCTFMMPATGPKISSRITGIE